MRSACIPALVLTLVLVRAVSADGLADIIPLYSPGGIISILEDEKGKKALNIASYQEAGIKASLKDWSRKQHQDADTIYKMTGPDKEARVRALTERRASELIQSLSRVLSPQQLKRLKQILLQAWGIVLFEFPEIRDALKLSAREADRLTKIYEDMRNEIAKKVLDRKLTQEEGWKQYQGLSRGVPDRVRAALSDDQQRILDDLLGSPYPWFEERRASGKKGQGTQTRQTFRAGVRLLTPT
jgi:hypothetical protein